MMEQGSKSWIYNWQSDRCPVDRFQMIEVLFKHGGTARRCHAGNFCWHRFVATEPSDIIAYRSI
jgi:hypothetical protein